MNPKITKRDMVFFVFGVLTFIVIELVSDWETHKKAFVNGWEDAKSENIVES
jgi:hypothetical protein